MTINDKLDSLLLNNQSNKQEITNIKANYETKLDNQMQHNAIIARIDALKISK